MNIVFEAPLLDDACDNLINTAKSRGGHDNITVVIIQFEKGGEEDDR
jgi:serine/threonine protein phosphatase PrpC